MKARSAKRFHLFDEPKRHLRNCDRPGCPHEGEFRAPRSRDQLNEYYWFCLSHIREYNASWDYYKGMSMDEIEREVRTSTTWERPTWPMGQKTSSRRFSFNINDPFDVFGENAEEFQKPHKRMETAEEEAMRVMALKELTLPKLKARYKQLAKLYHPDATGGDKMMEEKFKDITQAYQTLLTSLGA